MSVAEIGDNVLLGTDILRDGSLGSAQILLTEGRIYMPGISIPIAKSQSWSASHSVLVAERSVVPGLCEAITDMRIDHASTFTEG